MDGQRRASFERYSDDLDRWFDVRIHPDENGVSIYFTDVTERKTFERDLERTTGSSRRSSRTPPSPSTARTARVATG